MHTLVSKLVALSVEKYYMALTEIQLTMCMFHGSLSQKGSRSLPQTFNSQTKFFKMNDRKPKRKQKRRY